MRKRAVAIKAVRFELPAELLRQVREAATGDTLNRWALNALATGLTVNRDDIHEDKPRLNRGLRESLFLEIPPAFLERLDARAVHVNMKRSDFARACFARAVKGTRRTGPAVRT